VVEVEGGGGHTHTKLCCCNKARPLASVCLHLVLVPFAQHAYSPRCCHLASAKTSMGGCFSARSVVQIDPAQTGALGTRDRWARAGGVARCVLYGCN
jgi:hypothetical protein